MDDVAHLNWGLVVGKTEWEQRGVGRWGRLRGRDTVLDVDDVEGIPHGLRRARTIGISLYSRGNCIQHIFLSHITATIVIDIVNEQSKNKTTPEILRKIPKNDSSIRLAVVPGKQALLLDTYRPLTLLVLVVIVFGRHVLSCNFGACGMWHSNCLFSPLIVPQATLMCTIPASVRATQCVRHI